MQETSCNDGGERRGFVVLTERKARTRKLRKARTRGHWPATVCDRHFALQRRPAGVRGSCIHTVEQALKVLFDTSTLPSVRKLRVSAKFPTFPSICQREVEACS